MNGQEIINLYEQLAQFTRQMLDAAQSNEWDRLVEIEMHSARIVQRLRDAQPAPRLSSALRDQKVSLINRILADDRAIRHLTEPWMTRLSVLINSTGTERKLARAYHALPQG